MKHKE